MSTFFKQNKFIITILTLLLFDKFCKYLLTFSIMSVELEYRLTNKEK